MALESCTWRSPCNNPLADPTGEQDKLVNPQGPVWRLNVGNNNAFTPLEAPILPLVPSTKDFFTKFMKTFVELTQAWDREQAKPWEWPLKARSPETYLGESHMDCYHFSQQYKDYLKTSGTTGMNRTLFAVSFLHSIITLRWTQHKRSHQSATPITLSEFKSFFRKNLENSQAFINNIWSKFRKNSQ